MGVWGDVWGGVCEGRELFIFIITLVLLVESYNGTFVGPVHNSAKQN